MNIIRYIGRNGLEYTTQEDAESFGGGCIEKHVHTGPTVEKIAKGKKVDLDSMEEITQEVTRMGNGNAKNTVTQE